MKNKIEVKLEDFEKYRDKLTRYASGLLRSKGYGNFKEGELDDVAKDIVQNTYLTFHKYANDLFVSEFHLFNFLKSVLYNRYRENFNIKSNYYNISQNKGSIESLGDKQPVGEFNDEIDTVEKFIIQLNDEQKDIVKLLMSGMSGAEIAKDRGVSRQAINDRIKVIRNIYNKYESKNS
jgi:DNA-directed RNA polymerase specialized sigma24 family protein